eukprot:3658560-Pleurochrysis_carterae.AAC.2
MLSLQRPRITLIIPHGITQLSTRYCTASAALLCSEAHARRDPARRASRGSERAQPAAQPFARPHRACSPSWHTERGRVGAIEARAHST